MPPICYIIRVNGVTSELRRVLEILFAHGYVWREDRIRTFKEFAENVHYSPDNPYWDSWNYIAIPNKYECRMILECYIRNIDDRWFETTVEEYIEKYHSK